MNRNLPAPVEGAGPFFARSAGALVHFALTVVRCRTHFPGTPHHTADIVNVFTRRKVMS
jgi:hypothetical protein